MARRGCGRLPGPALEAPHRAKGAAAGGATRPARDASEPFGILLRRARNREVSLRDVRSGGMVAVAGPATRATPSGTSSERDHEGTTVGQADVREVQDHSPAWPRSSDLPEPTTQAAAGGTRLGSNRRPQHPAQQAG